jgi:hypothetical protein
MTNDLALTITGNLTADPELNHSRGGTPVASLTVATTPRHYDRAADIWADEETIYLRCTAWRHTAQNIAASLQKGDRVLAHASCGSTPTPPTPAADPHSNSTSTTSGPRCGTAPRTPDRAANTTPTPHRPGRHPAKSSTPAAGYPHPRRAIHSSSPRGPSRPERRATIGPARSAIKS